MSIIKFPIEIETTKEDPVLVAAAFRLTTVLEREVTVEEVRSIVMKIFRTSLNEALRIAPTLASSLSNDPNAEG